MYFDGGGSPTSINVRLYMNGGGNMPGALLASG